MIPVIQVQGCGYSGAVTQTLHQDQVQQEQPLDTELVVISAKNYSLSKSSDLIKSCDPHLARASVSSFSARTGGSWPSLWRSTCTRISVSQNADKSKSFPTSIQLLTIIMFYLGIVNDDRRDHIYLAMLA